MSLESSVSAIAESTTDFDAGKRIGLAWGPAHKRRSDVMRVADLCASGLFDQIIVEHAYGFGSLLFGALYPRKEVSRHGVEAMCGKLFGTPYPSFDMVWGFSKGVAEASDAM